MEVFAFSFSVHLFFFALIITGDKLSSSACETAFSQKRTIKTAETGWRFQIPFWETEMDQFAKVFCKIPI